MRSIGEINSEEQAKRFGDYLLANKIPCDIEDEEDGTWSIWIHDDDQIEKAEAELEKFNEAPKDSRYKNAEAKAEKIRRENEKADKESARRQVEVRTQTWNSSEPTPHLTYALIVACVGVFIALQTDMGDSLKQTLSISTYEIDGNSVKWPGLNDITQGEWWRLVTPIIIHLGWLHIAFNMMWLHQLGRMFEHTHGALKLIVFIIVTGILSNLFQYADFASGLFGRGPTFGGMSGVVYALAGYCWIRGRLIPFSDIELPPDTMKFLMIWFAICFLPFLPIANGGHTGGLLAGLAIGWISAQVTLRE
jgi:GlpG protein